MTIIIRPVQPTDYPALAAFYAIHFPTQAPVTEAQLQALDVTYEYKEQ